MRAFMLRVPAWVSTIFPFWTRRQVERIFTAELLEAGTTWQYGITEDEVREAFNLITTEWMAGDN